MNEPPVIQSPAREKVRRNTWLYILLAALLIVLLLLWAWRITRFHSRLGTPVVAQQTSAAQTAPGKKALTPQDFLGTWSGRWDHTWKVRFTISQDAQTGELAVVYDWEETLGRPLRQRHYAATLVVDTLRVGPKIEITLSVTNPNQAKAVGNFGNPRTADLIRE
jgi:hypothetical protein